MNELEKALPEIVTHGLEPGPWGFPLVAGRCPACGLSSLFLAVGGHVTCGNIPCPDPTAVTDMLHKRPA